MVAVLAIKIIFIFCMFASAGITGYLPLFVPSLHQNKTVLCLGNCFAAGIFIIVGVSGLLPIAQVSFDKIVGDDMPLAYVLAVFGYMVIFFIENIIFTHERVHNDDKETSNHSRKLINLEIDTETQNKTESKKINKAIPGIILSSALVVHSVFEGIAIGLLHDQSKVVTLCIAVLVHNIPAAIALAIKLGGVKIWVYCILMGAFVLSSPVSIMIGIFLSSLGYPVIEGIFLSISAGTFIYIGCTEILPEEMEKPGNKYYKFAAFSLGVIPLGISGLFFAD